MAQLGFMSRFSPLRSQWVSIFPVEAHNGMTCFTDTSTIGGRWRLVAIEGDWRRLMAFESWCLFVLGK